MKWKTEIAFSTALILFFLCASMLGIARAQAVIMGVSKGDTFTYYCQESYIPNQPDFASAYTRANFSETIRCTITEFTYPTLYANVTELLKNGTEISGKGGIDITNGGSLGGGWINIIPSNLGVNDSFLYFGTSLRINETVLKSYQGSERETNHFESIGTAKDFLIPGGPIVDWTYRSDMFFDKKTGVIVESYYKATNTNGSFVTTHSLSVNLQSSSVWTVPEFPSFIVVSFLMTATFAGAIILKRKHHNEDSQSVESEGSEDI